MALVCGPVFTALIALTSFLLSRIPDNIINIEHAWLKLSCITSFTAMVFIADRLGKRLQLTPQQFAGPVAFSCATFCLIAFLIFSTHY